MTNHTIKILVISALFIILSSCKTQKLPDVTLSVSTSKASYSVDEPVLIEATIKNNSADALWFSPRWIGNIKIVSLTHDGQTVIARETTTTYEVDLGIVLEGSLVEIPTSQSASILWGSQPEATINGHVLETVQLNAEYPHPTLLYPVNQPGSYQLSIAYHYLGETGGNTKVYQDLTNTAEVSFTVTP